MFQRKREEESYKKVICIPYIQYAYIYIERERGKVVSKCMGYVCYKVNISVIMTTPSKDVLLVSVPYWIQYICSGLLKY